MTWQATPLCAGTASCHALRLDAPISFWGGVDAKTSRITLGGHPQFGQTICGTILVIPELIGSSSSSAILLELIHAGHAPSALILGRRDAILPIGAIVAQQIDLPAPPILLLDAPPFQTGDHLSISADGTIEQSENTFRTAPSSS